MNDYKPTEEFLKECGFKPFYELGSDPENRKPFLWSFKLSSDFALDYIPHNSDSLFTEEFRLTKTPQGKRLCSLNIESGRELKLICTSTKNLSKN